MDTQFSTCGKLFFWCSMKKMYKYEKLSIGWNLLLINFYKAGIKNEDFLVIATSSGLNFFLRKWLQIDLFFSTDDGWWTKMSFWTLKDVNPADYGPKWPQKFFGVASQETWETIQSLFYGLWEFGRFFCKLFRLVGHNHFVVASAPPPPYYEEEK